VAGIRGGLAHNIRPITMSNAYRYAKTPAQAAAILNTPFCIIRTMSNESMTVPEYFGREEIESIYSPIIKPRSTDVFRTRNVVVLILESFGSEYIGAMNPGVKGIHDCTPFLDSLINNSLTFETSLANGRKSIDAMPSVFSGIPMLRDHLFLTPTIMAKEITGLAKELDTKGYYSAFFHGADNGSMGFQSFSKVIGYDDYFGMEDFVKEPEYGGNDVFDGYWAIWDEEFLQYFSLMLDTLSQPFLATLFTATSHHPFNIPHCYQDTFLGGNMPVYRTIQYTDHALRQFFRAACKMPWYDSTIFVITADHTNVGEREEYKTDLGLFRVPIILFDPSGQLPRGSSPAVMQQINIMPTLLNLLGYPHPYLAYGIDILNTPPHDSWAVSYTNGIYQYVTGDTLLHFDGQKVVGLYTLSADPLLKHNLLRPNSPQPDCHHLQAIIQSYMQRMINNQLVITSNTRKY
jgi:phosphoglycerol transferase MdoB-like AlkP superfamily enzyme